MLRNSQRMLLCTRDKWTKSKEFSLKMMTPLGLIFGLTGVVLAAPFISFGMMKWSDKVFSWLED